MNVITETTDKNNNLLVNEGFNILLESMTGYIGRELNKEYGDKWWKEVLYYLNDQDNLPYNGTYSDLINSLDVANCLRLIDRMWNDFFKERLKFYDCRTWAKELMGVRNRTAHVTSAGISSEDTFRAIDTMLRLCRCVDNDGAEELQELYDRLRTGSFLAIEKEESVGPVAIDVPINKSDIPVMRGGSVSNLIDLIGTKQVRKTKLTRKITFNGKTESYPVYKVLLNKLYYNDQNDRIATWISKYKTDNGINSLVAIKTEDYNDIIEGFIEASNPEALKRTQMNISMVGQREAGVTLADGRIVDGNRRFTCLRKIAKEKNEELYFETIILDVDAARDKKQIKLLELALQHGEEAKVDYDYIDYAIGTYNDIVITQLLTEKEYAETTNEKLSDVRKRITIAEIIVEFLEYIGLPGQYHIAKEYQVHSIFEEMLQSFSKLDDEEKRQLKTIVFNNVIMSGVKDQRKFIRDIKKLISNKSYVAFFKEQMKINEDIHKDFDAITNKSKDDIDKYANEHRFIGERIAISIEAALIKIRNQLVKASPLKTVKNGINSITTIDVKTFDLLDDNEKEELKKNLKNLSDVANMFLSMLEKNNGSGEQ